MRFFGFDLLAFLERMQLISMMSAFMGLSGLSGLVVLFSYDGRVLRALRARFSLGGVWIRFLQQPSSWHFSGCGNQVSGMKDLSTLMDRES